MTYSKRRRPIFGQLPPLLLPACLFLFLAFGLGQHTIIIACAILVLIIGSALLWRPLEPPILWFVFVYQWIEIFLLTFYANFKDIPLVSADEYSDPTYATWLAMLGLFCISVGMRVGAGSADSNQGQVVARQFVEISQIRLFKLYLVAVALTMVTPLIAGLIPGLSQLLLVSSTLRWTAYVIFTIASFRKPNASRGLWLLVFSFELVQGLGGYFSGFKFVFLYSFLGIMTARYRFNARQIPTVLILTVGALFMGVVWSEIKVEYRQYVSGGKRAQQLVTVGYPERISKLYELSSNIDIRGLQSGLDKMINRLAYISFFGAATHYVPAIRPHAGGAILFDAISRPFMPRLFFPDKPIIDESVLVEKYTGLRVGGFEQGTQVSLGFYGESYVDFGIYGVIFGLFGWGLFLGGTYRWLVNGRYSRGILGYGLATAVLLPAYGIGPSSAKLFGGIVTSLLVIYFFNRFIVPRYLRWLRSVHFYSAKSSVS